MTQPQPGDSSHSPVNQDQNMIGDLADCILEVLKTEAQAEVEPFENYAKALRLRLQADTPSLRERCAQGYESLLENLHSKDSF